MSGSEVSMYRLNLHFESLSDDVNLDTPLLKQYMISCNWPPRNHRIILAVRMLQGMIVVFRGVDFLNGRAIWVRSLSRGCDGR